MKKIAVAIALLIGMASAMNTQAQAWSRDAKVLSLGIGGANFLHFDPNGYYGPRYGFSRLTGQLTFQGEFGVHDYVGLGFTTGVGGGGAWGPAYSRFAEVNAPIDRR